MPNNIPSQLFVQFVQQGVKKGFIQDVTRTLDGEYYIDQDYLQDFVSRQVEAHSKINVEKLAELLNVEQFHVEKAIENLLESKDWTVIDDLVLTHDYMDDLEVQVQEKLIAGGSIAIVSQAQHMKIPYSLLKSVTDSIDDENIIRYHQIPDVISTREYIDTIKSKILDALKSADEPLAMFKLQKSQDIQEDMFYLLLEQIVKDSSFTLGTLRGKRSRAIFEPKTYKEGQLALIKSIFDSNKCISFHTIENLYPYSNATDLIADNYDASTYLTLHSCFIKISVKEIAKSVVESIKDYCDLNDNLPTNLTFDDVNRVMDIIISEINANVNNHKKLVVLDGGFVTTPDYINNTVLQTKPYLRNLGRTLKQKHRTDPVTASKMSSVTIIKALESTGCPRIMADKILPFTRTAVVNQFADILQTPYIGAEEIVSADQWVIDHKTRELTTLKNIRKSIYFNYQASQLFQDTSAEKSLEKFILKNQCIDFLYHLVLYLILSQSFNKAEVAESTSLCITMDDIEKQSIVDTKQQKCVVTYFIRENDHKYDKTAVVEIEDILKKKDIPLFIQEILIKDKTHLFKDEALDSPSTKSDANKIVYHQLHNQLESLQVSANSAPQLLHLTCLILFQNLYQIPLYVSGKFVPMILSEIKPKVKEPTQQALLETAHLSIINNNRDQHLDVYKKLKSIGMSYALASDK